MTEPSGSRSSTSGRTRSGSSSSPGATGDGGGSARTRSTRPVRVGEGLDATGELQPEPMERALETIELFAHFCRATGIDDVRAGRHLGDPRRDATSEDVPARGARALRARDRGALARGGGALRLPGGGQLDDARRRRRARPRRRLDAAHARRRSRRARDARSWPLGAVRMTERFLPGEQAPSASSSRRCATHVARRARASAAGSARRAGGWPAIGGTVRNLARRGASSRPSCRRSASRASRSTRDALDELSSGFADAARRRARRRCPGIKPERGDLILAGALVVADA